MGRDHLFLEAGLRPPKNVAGNNSFAPPHSFVSRSHAAWVRRSDVLENPKIRILDDKKANLKNHFRENLKINLSRDVPKISVDPLKNLSFYDFWKHIQNIFEKKSTYFGGPLKKLKFIWFLKNNRIFFKNQYLKNNGSGG